MTRRILDPFDLMRSNRVLAPHDPRLNDVRWLIGESLRRVHQRARLDMLRAEGFGPRNGLPQAEDALHARDKLRRVEEKVGAAQVYQLVCNLNTADAGPRHVCHVCHVDLEEIVMVEADDEFLCSETQAFWAMIREARELQKSSGADDAANCSTNS